MSRVSRGPDDVLLLLGRLHRLKDRAYGDAWRKRGEVLGIFTNIARKYDRLLIALGEDTPGAVEPIGDTIADLCVYAGKYATWLAETEPEAFAASGIDAEASTCAASAGPEALDRVFAALPGWGMHVDEVAVDIDVAVLHIRASFEELEQGLMAQAQGEPGPPADRKVVLALSLANATAWLLVHLSEHDPVHLEVVCSAVDAMEASS